MFDEMAIRKTIESDGKKNRGFLDFGTGDDLENMPVARHVLVYMVICLNGSWKIPIAYYFVDGLSADERKNITENILQKLASINLPVISITCDGPAHDINMAKRIWELR